MDSDTAMNRVQTKMSELMSQPDSVDDIVQEDLNSLRVAATTAAIGLTLEQAVQLAYQLYIQAGFDSATALARINIIMPQLTANPEAYSFIVQTDIMALGSAAVGATTLQLTQEQLVQQAYAQYIAQGMTSEQAFAMVNANLSTIIGN
ncbi:hypothetical protein [Lachnoclostridium sp. Marseille-P6806]|uniref:hypothetical protein n=1 Tax=Lachnoclostridium sp. Marseille-P6806 TaxID=2364793 RepID=UPI0013EF0D98|nr:hypothetical protein [Lachnoclostridium sp. Marseille-P6806]